MQTLTAKEILELFHANRDRLALLGVRDIALFGSFARGEQTEASDVDVLVELSAHTFDEYTRVLDFLTTLFGRKVDLVLRDALKPRLREHILAEAIRAA